MKELSIEEKAKAYDEALERAKELLEVGLKDTRDKRVVLSFFPELVESESEGVCRKLIAFLKQCKAVYGDGFKQFGLEIDDAIAWLEKQGEHANFRNKIQIGDKVTRNEDGVLVNLSQLNRVAKKDEKQGEQKPYGLREECKDCQCNYAGECKGSCAMKRNEQKLAEWNEDDQSNFCELRSFIVETYRAEDASRLITWLESLKERIQPQPKQEWSEEDERLFQIIIDTLDKEEHKGHLSHTDLIACVRKLKSLRPQSQWKPSEEQLIELRRVISGCSYDIEPLVEIEEHLKKLKG